MDDTFSLETVYNAWNDRNGRKVSVGPDSDALDLVEIIDHGEKDDQPIRITMEPTLARLVAQALMKAADDAEKVAE